jgi:PatG Domain
MDQTRDTEPAAVRAVVLEAPDRHGTPARGSEAVVAAHATGGSCSCGGGAAAVSSSYVYALGRIEPRFPTQSVEKELAQATSRTKTSGLSDRQALHTVLTKPENRYLVRQLCWVYTIGGVETYLLRPSDPADFHLLADAVRPTPRPTDVDVVIGYLGPVATPQMCNGLMVPIVIFDQIYSFDVDKLIDSIPRPDKIPADKFAPFAEELFSRTVQIADNAGATDEHRALNYLAVRYDAIYAKTAEFFGLNYSLSAIDVRPAPVTATRKIVDVVFTYTNRETGVPEKFYVRVDVTERFPFLVTKLGPYYDRQS